MSQDAKETHDLIERLRARIAQCKRRLEESSDKIVILEEMIEQHRLVASRRKPPEKE